MFYVFINKGKISKHALKLSEIITVNTILILQNVI